MMHCITKITTFGITSLIFMGFCLPIAEIALANSQNQSQDPANKKGQRKNQGQNPNQKKGVNQAKDKSKRGPAHVFSGDAPKHDYDLIMTRPTDKSITFSILAYKPGQAYQALS